MGAAAYIRRGAFLEAGAEQRIVLAPVRPVISKHVKGLSQGDESEDVIITEEGEIVPRHADEVFGGMGSERRS